MNKPRINVTTQSAAPISKPPSKPTNVSVTPPVSPFAKLPTLTLDKSPNDVR